MEKAIKYTFNESFDGGSAHRQQLALERRHAELAAAREAGYEAGLAAGKAQAREALEARAAILVEDIAAQLKTLFAERQKLSQSLTAESARLAHAIGLCLAERLVQRQPLAEIEALVRECFSLSHGEPRLVIRVHEDLVEPMKNRSDAMAEAAGYPGRVILIADDTLEIGDCLVEWPDGGVERRSATLQAEINAIIDRYLHGAPVDAQKPGIAPEEKGGTLHAQ
ncbi:MAG: hypothetical protein ACOY99_03870 [Pseudomonadota bacterium]